MDGVAGRTLCCQNGDTTDPPIGEHFMSNEPSFDLSAAHKYFSVDCFNRAWDIIDKTIRTPAEEEQMLLLAFASFYHWTQRPDCSAENVPSRSGRFPAFTRCSARPKTPAVMQNNAWLSATRPACRPSVSATPTRPWRAPPWSPEKKIKCGNTLPWLIKSPKK